MEKRMNNFNACQNQYPDQSKSPSVHTGAMVPGIRILSSWLQRRPTLIKTSLRLL